MEKNLKNIIIPFHYRIYLIKSYDPLKPLFNIIMSIERFYFLPAPIKNLKIKNYLEKNYLP